MEDFESQTEFLNALGAIDCTHVAMWVTRVYEYVYVNQKNFHSINAPLIWNACTGNS